MTMNENTKDYTVKELAALTNLDPSRIRQLLLDGTIKGIKRTPYFWLISYEEGQRFIEIRKKEGK